MSAGNLYATDEKLVAGGQSDGHSIASIQSVADTSITSESVSGFGGAHETVERTTRELVVLIKSAQQYIKEDEPRFYRELGELLERYVDFKSFSRAVMGKYASARRVESLDEEQAELLNMQIERFTHIFTGALINTYGKGLLVFEGERIEVVPPSESSKPSRPGRATVKQLVFGDRDTPYEIHYSLRQNKAGEWKIRNMVLETTNLGKVYRNQFDNAYRVYEGDIDRVIDTWVSG